MAGRVGHFELVVGVEQDGDGRVLHAEGAHRVISDLGDILEQVLAP